MFMSPDLITRSAFAIPEGVLFIYYLITTRRYLRIKKRGVVTSTSLNEIGSLSSEYNLSERDPYTLAMLALISMGIGFRLVVRLPFDVWYMATLQPPEDPDYAVYKNEDYKYSWVEIMHAFLSYSPMRIAIVVNLVRWVILYLSLKLQATGNQQAFKRNKTVALLGLWIAVTIQYTIVTLDKFYTEIDGTWVEISLDVWNQYIVVAAPIIAYSILYALLRRHYLGLIAKNK